MTEKNNGIQRFSNRVENYIKYRPSYPSEIISFLKHEINLSSETNSAVYLPLDNIIEVSLEPSQNIL